MTSKRIKYLEVNLTKEEQGWYAESAKHFQEKSEQT
jgi:hypothetical protein